jgi:hypothetical protein
MSAARGPGGSVTVMVSVSAAAVRCGPGQGGPARTPAVEAALPLLAPAGASARLDPAVGPARAAAASRAACSQFVAVYVRRIVHTYNQPLVQVRSMGLA